MRTSRWNGSGKCILKTKSWSEKTGAAWKKTAALVFCLSEQSGLELAEEKNGDKEGRERRWKEYHCFL